MADTGAIRALLIEDNPADALMVREMLREAGESRFRMETTARLGPGLTALETGRFDVVLLDLNLPDSRGFSTFEKVQSAVPDLPVILLTALDDKHLAEQALQSGGQDYLVKGQIDSHLLDRSIRYAIERKRVAAENLRLYQQAEEANRAKDEFLATLSHELRTPLSSILGWAAMLRRGGLDPETTERALETVERNARLQVRLIDDLLDISRIVTGKLKLDMRPVNLITAMLDAIEAVRVAAESKEIMIVRRIDSDVPSVLGDPERLQQVLWNLLSNAVKFTSRGGRVDVELRSDAGTVEVRVHDDGIGIAAENLPYVFERFRQVDSSAIRAHSGMGLGLALVRQLVELHGGTVSAASPGRDHGSTFTVRLPVRRASPEERARKPSSIPPESGPSAFENLHVLIVEDDPDQILLTRTILEAHGARITAAANADAGYQALVDSSPDVILADIAMPGEDGYRFLARVRRLPEARGGRIPAAAITAYARPEDEKRALESGFQAWVAKPIDPSTLVAVVKKLVRGKPRTA